MKYWILNKNHKVIKTFYADSINKELILQNHPIGYSVMKSYCCCFTEIFLGHYIGLCCKKHDNTVGQAGTYNPITPHIVFYKCLKRQNIPFGWRAGMIFGAVVGSWIKQPYLWYKIHKYRKINLLKSS